MGKTKVNLGGATNIEKDILTEELPKKKNKKIKVIEPQNEVKDSDDIGVNHETKRDKRKPHTKKKSQGKVQNDQGFTLGNPEIDCNPEKNVKAQDFGSKVPKNKNKRKKEEIQEPTDDDSKILRIKKDKKERKKKSNCNIVDDSNKLLTISKKIVFIDDKPVSASVSTINSKKSVKISKKHFNEDEEEVKEEDIDQFCDEITEEDNVQYENWIKLLEAKLGSNKQS